MPSASQGPVHPSGMEVCRRWVCSTAGVTASGGPQYGRQDGGLLWAPGRDLTRGAGGRVPGATEILGARAGERSPTWQAFPNPSLHAAFLASKPLLCVIPYSTHGQRGVCPCRWDLSHVEGDPGTECTPGQVAQSW